MIKILIKSSLLYFSIVLQQQGYLGGRYIKTHYSTSLCISACLLFSPNILRSKAWESCGLNTSIFQD